MALVQFSKHRSSGREDSHPEDVCLAERQAYQTKYEQSKVPPDLLDVALIGADQGIETQHDRQRGSHVRVIERREEE